MHQVAVLGEGFAWNGQTYPSLSKVASAITGTRWNGPKFSACHINQGKAATVQLTPLQAQDVSGTGSKAIGATQIWSDLNESAGDQLTKQANAASYTTDAGLHTKVVVFEISPQDCIDVANGFHSWIDGPDNTTDYLQFGASGNGNMLMRSQDGSTQNAISTGPPSKLVRVPRRRAGKTRSFGPVGSGRRQDHGRA